MRTRAGLASVLVALALGAAAQVAQQKPGVDVPGEAGGVTLLHSGWKITPAGRGITTGDALLGGALSPDGKLLAIANAGFNQHALHIVDVGEERVVASVPLGRAWNGIAWDPSGTRIWVAGGVRNFQADVHSIERAGDGTWKAQGGLKLAGSAPDASCVAGLALRRDGRTLFAVNVSDNHLYVLDTQDGTTLARLPVGDHPIAARLSVSGETLYVANWGGSELVAVDVRDAARPAITARWRTGEHPNDIAVDRADRLFVSCGNEDVVSVLDPRTGRTLETIKTSLSPRAALGSTPNALALAPDGSTLYVANADNNTVCVVDVRRPGRSRVRGFIPTGWYPTAVAVSADGKKLIIGSGKGAGTRPNPARRPINQTVPAGFTYIARQLSGLLSFVDTPDEAALRKHTSRVWANTPYRDAQLRQTRSAERTAVPTRVGGRSPIKYVLYIIKENRTYDQVFGDIGRGNSDPSLCLFGQEVTPNQHALANEFVLLDNLYCSGEVSADGHPWSTSAYATDYTQRNWLLSYSGHGSIPRTDSVGDPRGGYIWDACKRKGLSYRSYGEYVHAASSADAPEQRVAGAPGLIGHGSPAYVGIGWKGPGPMRDTDKADVFIQEFREYVEAGTVPRFMIMSLGENHTRGTTAGAFTPKSCVASNDLALGKIVEAVTHSSVWKETAIFVIEDDAQNGPDHVDSHRTVGLVISPYARRGALDSTMYSTASMLRTMELILGLPPLTQHDAAATPMFGCFTNTPDLRPYSALPARIDLSARNSAAAYGAAQSARMDWSEYDRIDEDALNRILWHSIRGADAPYPAPVRSAVISASGRMREPDGDD